MPGSGRGYGPPVLAAFVVFGLAAPGAGAQSVTERSPNLSWGWTGDRGTIHLNTVHRLHVGDERSLSNVPTLLLGATVHDDLLVGLQYSSRSVVGAGSPNEWELFGRRSLRGELGGLPVHAGLTLAYNQAAGSADGEIALGARTGPLHFSGALRGFTDAFDTGESGGAAALGARIPLTQSLAVAGDVVFPIELGEGARTGWSGALQTRIPFTPHSLSFQVTNVGTATLQGSSRGLRLVRWGFEFTVPLTLARFRRPAPAAGPPAEGEGEHAELLRELDGNTVVVMVEEMAFGMERIVVPAGTRVVWVNRDPVVHTATADDGSWDSGSIAQGETWSRVFAEPGEYPFYCVPHPYMTGVVVVEPGGGR